MNLDRAIHYFKITASVVSTISALERASQYGGRAYQYIAPYISTAAETVSSDVSWFFSTLITSKVTPNAIGMALGNYAISKIAPLKGDPRHAFVFTGVAAASATAFGPSILLPCVSSYVFGRCITYVYGPVKQTLGYVESLLLGGAMVGGMSAVGPLALIPCFTYSTARNSDKE